MSDPLPRLREVLVPLAEQLHRALGLDQVLEVGLDLLLELTGMRVGWVSLREGEGFRLALARNLPPGLEAEDRALMRFSPCRCQRLLLAGELREAWVVLECERLALLRERLAGAPPEAVAEATGRLAFHLTLPLRAAVTSPPGGHRAASPQGEHSAPSPQGEHSEEVLGVVNLARPGPEPPDADLLPTLTLAGQILGMAVHRALLHEAAREAQLGLWEGLLDLGRDLLASPTREGVAEALRRGLRRLGARTGLPLVRAVLTVFPPGSHTVFPSESELDLDLGEGASRCSPSGEATGPDPWRGGGPLPRLTGPSWQGRLGYFPFRVEGTGEMAALTGALAVVLDRPLAEGGFDEGLLTRALGLVTEMAAQA